MTKHDLINEISKDLPAELNSVELKVRLDEIAADEARRARELESAAREAAMTNAQQKAEQLTELAGAELGPVQTIVETGNVSPVPVTAAQEESLGGGVPIQPGAQTIEAGVRVTWEIQ